MHFRSIIVAVGIIAILLLLLALIAPFLSTQVDRLPPGVSSARSTIAQITLALKTYKQDFGQYPTGSKSEIIQALSGKNSKEIIYLDIAGLRRSVSGELLDPWKRSFEIILDSDSDPKVRSAGRNGAFEHDKTHADDVALQ